MQTVRAIRRGFDGATLRRKGEVFQVPDSARASWFVPASADVEPTPVSGEENDAGKPKGKFSAGSRAKKDSEPADPASP